MSFFEQILRWAIHNRGSLLFGLIWIITTASAAIWVALAVRRGASTTNQQVMRRPFSLILTWQQARAPRVVAALTLLVMFLASYIGITLVWEDFAYYDNSDFTLWTQKGHNFQVQIIPAIGRFLPFGGQEFSLIRHFTDTIAGYHVLPIVELLMFFCILLILDTEVSIMARAALAILALLIPSILTSFTELTFDERNILFFVACLALFVKRFEETQSVAWAVAAVVCGQIIIYFKETAFLLLLGFAIVRLVLRCTNGHLAEWKYDRLWVRESRLDLCLASLALLFLILYFGFIGIHGNQNYAASAQLPRADTVLGYTKVDLLAWLLVAVVLGRTYLILRHRAAPLLLWDGLAVGGVACFVAYLYLSIFGIYYLAPVDLIAILYVGRFMVLSWEKTRSWGRITAMLLALIVVFQEILVSAFVIFERKNVIHAKAEIASAVETQYRQRSGNDLRLFFPFAGGYVIMEFGAYLGYWGVPVEGAADEVSGLNSVVLAEARRTRAKNSPRGPFEDGPCVEWRRIWCQIVNAPAPGDLVIVLPDDEASLAETSVYRERGELLLHYEPRPQIPHWLRWLFNSLPIGPQTRYRSDALPDRWMDGSVTKWK